MNNTHTPASRIIQDFLTENPGTTFGALRSHVALMDALPMRQVSRELRTLRELGDVLTNGIDGNNGILWWNER